MTETKLVETGKVELIVRVPDLSPENALIIARDMRHTLENCARLELLDEFIEVVRAEHTGVLAEVTNR